MKDGNFLINNRPVFLMGTHMGSGQWNLKHIWLTRLHAYDFDVPAAYGNMPMYCVQEKNSCIITMRDSPWFNTMLNEVSASRVYSYVDCGSDNAERFQAKIIDNGFLKFGMNTPEVFYNLINPFYF
ncbi:MAG: hypothetical protein A2096_09575 [Spirochaetes bacterium GWF1_41_5]|nr:MAG: hypothetical protein A2096_09575 [Spirochaetes bacterium GWF1_41_5]